MVVACIIYSMLLVHTCCADCSLKFIESLKNSSQNFTDNQITLYYYAPNTHPRSEFLARLEALKKIISTKKAKYKLVVEDYQPQDYFAHLSWTDNSIPKKNYRCPNCWQLRLEKTFKFAKENAFKQVSTTMLVSNYMDVQFIAKLGQELAKKYQLEFLVPSQIYCQLKTKGFYKQNYCGCCFSLLEKNQEKFVHN